jgi:hypothetical protein
MYATENIHDVCLAVHCIELLGVKYNYEEK